MEQRWCTNSCGSRENIDAHCISAAVVFLRRPLLYLDRRAHTAVTHPEWNPGHGLNDALRTMGKELLKQLWRAASKPRGSSKTLIIVQRLHEYIGDKP